MDPTQQVVMQQVIMNDIMYDSPPGRHPSIDQFDVLWFLGSMILWTVVYLLISRPIKVKK